MSLTASHHPTNIAVDSQRPLAAGKNSRQVRRRTRRLARPVDLIRRLFLGLIRRCFGADRSNLPVIAFTSTSVTFLLPCLTCQRTRPMRDASSRSPRFGISRREPSRGQFVRLGTWKRLPASSTPLRWARPKSWLKLPKRPPRTEETISVFFSYSFDSAGSETFNPVA